MNIWNCVFLCAILLLAASCAQKKETVPVTEEVISQPFQEIDTTTMTYYNGAKIQWKLESKHMKKVLGDTGHVQANPVLLNVYDSLGKEITRVISDSGTVDGAMKQFCVWGNVFVKAQNGVRVKSQRLYWNLTTHRITSKDYVQIKTIKGDVLQGKGLDAAEDFSWWKFEHDVSGRFPNFKERVEKGGEF
jgi:LPS export ABC transporter protein LptC